MRQAAERRSNVTTSRRFVLVAFALVGIGVLLITVFSIGQARRLESRAHDIVDNMLTSVRLAGQMDSKVRQKQALIGEHILAEEPSEMAKVEARMATIESEIDATMRAYDPWANQPGERASWDTARADMLALKESIARTLTLSRENHKLEARHAMRLVAAQFTRVSADLDDIISINDKSAADSVAQLSTIRRRLTLTLLGIGLFALLGTALLGLWAAAQVRRREEETSRMTTMLEERNKQLDSFAAQVAHDIRGPLTAIGLAANQLPTASEGSRTKGILQRGVQRMQSLVNDLLALAQVEGNARGSCDPAAVAAQIREEFTARFESERGALRLKVDHSRVSCSEGLLRQALTNLTENAVKYRRPEVAPEVEISGSVTDDRYALHVSDNGLGMSPEEADRVFEPFYRSPRTRDRPRTGLGLSTVSRVVKASGGALAVQSRLGQGSTFIMRLRLEKGEGQAPERRG